jgi:uncharacterized protein
MAEMGTRCSLRILKSRSAGMYVDAGELGEILLPGNETSGLRVGDDVEVFLYFDSGDRPIATRKSPIAMPGEFALLTVVANNDYGAFLDWGLPKELMVPFREQTKQMIVGRHYVVRIYTDEKSGRIAASQRISRYVKTAAAIYRDGDQVQALLWGKTDLGYKAIIDGKYNGLIFENQVFKKLNYGDVLTAYVTETRSDGKLSVNLEPPGRKKILNLADRILEILQESKRLDLTDDSPAMVVQKKLGVSKKAYKQAIGQLFRQKKIMIMPDHIALV